MDAIDLARNSLDDRHSKRMKISNVVRAIFSRSGLLEITVERMRRLLCVDEIFSDSNVDDYRFLELLSSKKNGSEVNDISGWAAIGNLLSDSDARARLNALVKGGFVASSNIDEQKITVRITEAGRSRLVELNARAQKISMRTSDRMPFTPIYLSHLTVGNFRCFTEKQTIEFVDDQGEQTPWTLILGDNGVGKSSILQLVAGLFPIFDDKVGGGGAYRTQLEAFDLGIFSGAARNARENTSVELKVQYHDNKGRLRHAGFGAAINKSMSDLEDDLKCEYEEFSIRMNIRSKGVIYYSAGEGLIGSIPPIISYSAMRGGVESISLHGSWRASEHIDGLFGGPSRVRDPEEWLLQLDYSAKFDSRASRKAQERFKGVQEMLVRILPDVRGLEIQPPDAHNQQPRLRFLTPYGKVSFRDLSVGYQTMLAMAVDLAIRLIERYDDANSALQEPAIVLIDEIDLHLHPRWQQEVVGWLGDVFPGVQFIATTHSPIVAQGASTLNLAVLRRVDSGVDVLNQVDEIRDWRVDQILTSELFNLDTLIPARSVPEYEERISLLKKRELSREEGQRLAELNEYFRTYVGGNLADKQAMDIIRAAAAKISEKN